MSILSDREIKDRCIPEAGELLYGAPMISPYSEESVRYITDIPHGDRKVLSFGQSSYGYDVRLDNEFKIFSNINSGIIDPKRLDPETLVDGKLKVDEYGDKYVILPPHSYLLGKTMEYFNVPRDIMIVCLGKSSYARAGIIVNVTPIEPGFEGNVVIEISNSTPLPAKIYSEEGISQFLFFQGNAECETSYADRDGKYMNQTSIQLPFA